MRKCQLKRVLLGLLVLGATACRKEAPASAPMRRLREDARQENRLIDATQGRKTRAIVVTDSNHVILSAIQAETIGQRFQAEDASSRREEE